MKRSVQRPFWTAQPDSGTIRRIRMIFEEDVDRTLEVTYEVRRRISHE